MFEWVYFASAESELQQTPVYSARLDLGRNLAARIGRKMKEGLIQADLVAPVPDTSRTAAISLAETLGLPYREVLIKNRYITRTFILGSQDRRKKAVDLKLNPVVSELRGKSIILVDDSIVRGTTSTKIVDLVRRAGAKRVYFASTCPPIRFPCFYGIDFPDPNELIAHAEAPSLDLTHDLNRLEDAIAKRLGADGVVYQDLPGLERSLQSAGKPCTACITGQYPTDVSASARFSALRLAQRGAAV
jgi:amidophosphoribosyltransferase